MDKKIVNLVIWSEWLVWKYLCDFLKRKWEDVIRFDIKRGEKEDARYAKLPLKWVDKVFFLAWDVWWAKYLYRWDNQLHQLEWNVALLSNVMPQLEKSKVQFVFTSTQLAEENTVYWLTKRIWEFWTHLIWGIFIRLTNVYWADEEWERSHVIPDFIRQAKKWIIKMLSSWEEKRQFIHLEDMCETIYGTKNNWVSIKDVADMIQTITLEEWLKKMIKKSKK
jgi:nucleoside-diphosphate-sugar epimerase